MTTEPLVWYFDVISPFAYLALPDVEALPTPVTYRPVLFGAVLKHWGQLGPAEIPPKRVHTYRLCVWTAERLGIPLRFPPTHPFNPLNTLRLLTALDAAPAAVRTAMDVIWRDGVDVGGPDGWSRLVAALGVHDADALITATGAKDRLRTATEAAVALGVYGVPTLAVGPDLFWGLDAMPMARAAQSDPALLTTGEMARVATLGQLHRKQPTPGA